jgi:ligand-binding SRPBCC domain-containing protein
MKKIEKSTMIDCSVEDLYQFHLDSNNITKITPKSIEVRLLNDDTTTYEGKIVKLVSKKFFISTYWEVKIEKLEENAILVDKAIKSPFKYWRHQHIFLKQDSGCELKDIIEFELPFGLIGKLVEPLISMDITSMFDYRHKRTKEILESKIVKES